MRTLARSLVVVAIALAGCARGEKDIAVGAPTTEYSALGREPDWALRFDRARISFTGGDTRIAVERPLPTATAVGQRYDTSRLSIDIVPGACGSALNGSGFEDRVTVTVAGRTLRGCGGNRLPDRGF